MVKQKEGEKVGLENDPTEKRQNEGSCLPWAPGADNFASAQVEAWRFYLWGKDVSEATMRPEEDDGVTLVKGEKFEEKPQGDLVGHGEERVGSWKLKKGGQKKEGKSRREKPQPRRTGKWAFTSKSERDHFRTGGPGVIRGKKTKGREDRQTVTAGKSDNHGVAVDEKRQKRWGLKVSKRGAFSHKGARQHRSQSGRGKGEKRKNHKKARPIKPLGGRKMTGDVHNARSNWSGVQNSERRKKNGKRLWGGGKKWA